MNFIQKIYANGGRTALRVALHSICIKTSIDTASALINEGCDPQTTLVMGSAALATEMAFTEKLFVPFVDKEIGYSETKVKYIKNTEA